METAFVVLGWTCLALGFVFAVPLMVLGAKFGGDVGRYLGSSLGSFFKSLLK
jgi:hypothetical protein